MRTPRRSIFSLTALALLTVAAHAAVSNPVGSWETTVSGKSTTGKDSGVMRVTFAEGGTLSGFGVSALTPALFILQGTWSLDAKGGVTGSFTQTVNGATYATGTFTGKATAGKSLSFKATQTFGTYTIKGVPLATGPNLGGVYSGTVKQPGLVTNISFTLAASSQNPGAFTVTGSGTSPEGPITFSGSALATAKGATALSVTVLSGGTTSLAGFYGKFNAKSSALKLKGVDLSEGAKLSLSATRN